jgi:hypothetical protein
MTPTHQAHCHSGPPTCRVGCAHHCAWMHQELLTGSTQQATLERFGVYDLCCIPKAVLDNVELGSCKVACMHIVQDGAAMVAFSCSIKHRASRNLAFSPFPAWIPWCTIWLLRGPCAAAPWDCESLAPTLVRLESARVRSGLRAARCRADYSIASSRYETRKEGVAQMTGPPLYPFPQESYLPEVLVTALLSPHHTRWSKLVNHARGHVCMSCTPPRPHDTTLFNRQS